MLNARQCTDRLAELLRREHAALADFLVALAEFDRARGWVALGHSSLFYFLHRELGLSIGAAYHRKVAAELIARYPEVLDAVRDGRLCISSVVELAKVITPENRAEILPRFFHCSKQEAKAVAAELRPAEAAPHRDVVTAVHAPAPRADAARGPAPSTDRGGGDLQRAAAPAADPARAFHLDETEQTQSASTEAPRGPEARRDGAEPLTAELSRLHVTVSRRFLAKLEAARSALSHARPGASTEAILEAALDLLLERHARTRGIVANPRATVRAAKPDHLPAAVKREVWERDGGRCQWPLASGGVCASTERIEFDHEVPQARGGPSTIDNVRLLCRFHNDLAAREAFGDEWMDRFTRRRGFAATRPSLGPSVAPGSALAGGVRSPA